MTRCWLTSVRGFSTRLRYHLQLRMCSFAETHNTSSLSLASEVIHNDSQTGEKRQSRKRYSAANTKGRSKHIQEIILSLKSSPKDKAISLFEKMHPRDKLDILRTLSQRRERRAGGLPSYKSHLFERRYFFKEDDLCEQSTLGRGPGGQATNRRMQTAIIKHIPSGIIVKFSKFPSYWLNRRAAREILNLRLEEYLLGSKSRLGRIKRQKEKQRLYRFQSRRKMVEKGSIMVAKLSQQHEYYAVLTGTKPFPPPVLLQLGVSNTDKTLFISSLFEEDCGKWWPMLSTAFTKVNTGDSIKENSNDYDESEINNLKVPELFRYVFPVIYFSSKQLTSVEKCEWSELKKSANDEVAMRNVIRGLHCFVEMFGLHLSVKSSTNRSGSCNLVLAQDGLNWYELRGRMVSSSERMTPLALICFAHLALSLTQLRRKNEVNAIMMFFRRESKLGVKAQWATHGLKTIERFIENHKSFQSD
ncbi:putative peptide chain release factor 1 [Trypanosoma theileri]|uniref:Putative peptide chain release factor 1 n=1 Tax=Trypanosoma theileri TaxID=67003 RepID=A0A1X0P2E4_9TRYP|nr:putative peptide chain release factor 1 [Trypanosoma theileri]ORC90699.1 putative peptide chain release factor 1 [Trypanosoma theileri]